MTIISLFIQGSALGITAGASPGPLQTYLISETLSGGWQRSLPLIFVPILSDAPIVVLTTFILGQLPDMALQGISIFGGLFVFYLAWGLWQRWQEDSMDESNSKENPQRSFGRAVVMNLLNPNPYIFWTFVSGPILIDAIQKSWGYALIFFLGFYGVFMATMVTLIALFHQTRKLGPRVVHAIQLISILILVVFGGILIKEGMFG
jgi:threonine/homoserine/homoserine lactone efflux protein